MVSNENLHTNYQVLNFHVLYNNPLGVYDFLNNLNHKQITNIKKIYYLLDTHIFCGDMGVNKYFGKNKYQIFFDQLKNFNLTKIDQAYKTIIINTMPKYIFEENYVPYYYVSNLGHTLLVQDRTWDGIGIEVLHEPNFSLSTIKTLKKINDWVKNNNKEIIFYTPTHSLEDFNLHVNEKFMRTIILQRFYILDYIDGMYDFSLVESLSRDKSLFEDSFHLNNRGFAILFNKINWDLYYVNKNNYMNKINKIFKKWQIEEDPFWFNDKKNIKEESYKEYYNKISTQCL